LIFIENQIILIFAGKPISPKGNRTDSIQKRSVRRIETFEKCSISFKFKEDENFDRRNTLSILRIKI
jgi:hypothetical protein